MMGRTALINAVSDLRQRGKTIVLITHRTSALSVTNKLLLLRDGTVNMFGSTQDVMNALNEANQQQVLAQQTSSRSAGPSQPKPKPKRS
jgi:ATP-binding cassette subfamily C exporter for protease/lipase